MPLMPYFEAINSMLPKHLREQSSQQSKLEITISFPCKESKSSMRAQFIRSDKGCEVSFIYVFPVESLNVSESVKVPFGKEKLKQIFLELGTKRSSGLCSYHAVVMP